MRKCPHRIDNDDGTAADCIKNGHCGCDETYWAALLEFFRWSMASGPWGGNDLDGADVQNQAERLGLIVKVPYDPAKHGEAICEINPGDDWFVMAPWVNS